MKKELRTKIKKSAQEMQDEVFRKMTVAKKIKLASELTAFCVKLNHLNGNYKSRKPFVKNSAHS